MLNDHILLQALNVMEVVSEFDHNEDKLKTMIPLVMQENYRRIGIKQVKEIGL